MCLRFVHTAAAGCTHTFCTHTHTHTHFCIFEIRIFTFSMMRSKSLIPVFVVAVVVSLLTYNSIRCNRQFYLQRIALLHPKFSAWRRLLNCGDESSFISVTGFDFKTFRDLVSILRRPSSRRGKYSTAIVFPYILQQPSSHTGRPKLLCIEDELGLYLFYVNSTMKAKNLAMLFGIIPSSVCISIRAMMVRIVKHINKLFNLSTKVHH